MYVVVVVVDDDDVDLFLHLDEVPSIARHWYQFFVQYPRQHEDSQLSWHLDSSHVAIQRLVTRNRVFSPHYEDHVLIDSHQICVPIQSLHCPLLALER